MYKPNDSHQYNGITSDINHIVEWIGRLVDQLHGFILPFVFENEETENNYAHHIVSISISNWSSTWVIPTICMIPRRD